MVLPRLDLEYIEINTVLSAAPINQELAAVEHWIDLSYQDAPQPVVSPGGYFGDYFGGQLFGVGYFG